jgi:hypothetical protein
MESSVTKKIKMDIQLILISTPRGGKKMAIINSAQKQPS